MKDKIKFLSIGVILATFIFLLGERSYHTFSWAGQVNREAQAGAQTYAYLSQPVLVNGKPLVYNGKQINRAQLLELVLQGAAQRVSQSASSSSPGNGKN